MRVLTSDRIFSRKCKELKGAVKGDVNGGDVKGCDIAGAFA